MQDKTYYRLKKDLPMFKAGDVFYVDNMTGDLHESKENTMVYDLSTLEGHPNILSEWFEKTDEPKKKGRIVDDEREYYYAIDDKTHFVMPEKVNNKPASLYQYLYGNYFIDEVRASNYLEYKLALERILSNSSDYTTSASIACRHGYLFTVYIDEEDDLVAGSVIEGIWFTVFPLFFESLEAAKKSLRRNAKDWATLANYDFAENFYRNKVVRI